MPPVSPYIPERITVHLGPPSSNAENVTVDFVDYVKNVASSEIYPTWEESALRANILAIVFYIIHEIHGDVFCIGRRRSQMNRDSLRYVRGYRRHKLPPISSGAVS